MGALRDRLTCRVISVYAGSATLGVTMANRGAPGNDHDSNDVLAQLELFKDIIRSQVCFMF